MGCETMWTRIAHRRPALGRVVEPQRDGLAEELDENGNPKKLYGFDARLITDGGVVL